MGQVKNRINKKTFFIIATNFATPKKPIPGKKTGIFFLENAVRDQKMCTINWNFLHLLFSLSLKTRHEQKISL